MNLETLQARQQEIDTAIVNTTAQLNMLHGHKTETLHWISQLQSQKDETLVEPCEVVAVE